MPERKKEIGNFARESVETVGIILSAPIAVTRSLWENGPGGRIIAVGVGGVFAGAPLVLAASVIAEGNIAQAVVTGVMVYTAESFITTMMAASAS